MGENPSHRSAGNRRHFRALGRRRLAGYGKAYGNERSQRKFRAIVRVKEHDEIAKPLVSRHDLLHPLYLRPCFLR